ncbi:rhodanese-like domain-containing protein [Pseudomonadales bacterium]|nr:rhodanese-like domain-containing protein [Pseudomonadales bacterium]MDB9867751.1 rhodanese-like domain-containing protein [Pseudomonadales bacterium]MDB9917398.1 rhodanese-like domain-containing protein [Pseudomonadales bacterium]
MYHQPEPTGLNTLPLWRALLAPTLTFPVLKFATLIALALSGAVKAETALEKIEQALIANHHIQQISNRVVLDDLTAGGSTLVLFDIRGADEFAVSHLTGAIRLDPETTAEAFFAAYAPLLITKQAVFYCSVGRRSTALALTIARQIRPLDAIKPPANMIGGIFRWHNESKPLVNANGATDKVHPYSWYWKRLLKYPAKAASKP